MSFVVNHSDGMAIASPDTAGEARDRDAANDSEFNGESATRLAPIANDYRTMLDLVFTNLRDEILAGRMKPGERLNTAQLAQRLGVSRTPVREAINRLVSVGLVETISHRGAFVKKLSIEEVIEIYTVRAALEGMSARLAVRHLTHDDILLLRSRCEETEGAIARLDDDAFMDINFEFHNIVHKASHSRRLQELIGLYYSISTQYRALGLDLPGRHEEIRREHQQLVQALEAGDPDLAEQSAREHHLNTARRIARSIGNTDYV